MRRSIWIGCALLTAALGVFVIWRFHRPAELDVTTAAATAGTITRRIIATGTLQAVTTVEIGVQVSGVIQSLQADFNSFVKAGDVVARLDPVLYAAQLRQAQATLKQADANVDGFKTAVEDTRTKLTRARALWAKLLIPRSDLDAAEIAMNEAAADLQAGESQAVLAKAGVYEAQVNLDHTIIRSPIDGVVIERDVDVGQTLAASLQSPVIFRIASDIRKMQVQVQLDESDVGGVAPGEAATFEVESYPDEMFHGTVSQLRLQPVTTQAAATTPGASTTTTTTTSAAPAGAGTPSTVAPSVVSYTTIVDVANADERLRPGMTATVVLSGTRRENVVRIPNNALSFRPPPDVVAASGAIELPADPADAVDGQDAEGKARQAWQYDNNRFKPIAVRVGLADEQWTEMIRGKVHPADRLVTSAVLKKR
jgi:HlyD family secretion protein